ncbi:MAG: peptidylprolyl isomerase [candidate division WOR-3 bacterium]
MKVSKNVIVLTTLFFILFNFSGCSKKDNVIAKVDNKVLFESTFKKMYVPMPNLTKEENLKKAEDVLNNLINQMIVYNYMEKNNLLTEDLITQKVQSENSRLIGLVYDNEVTKKVKISEKELWDTYIRNKTTIWAQHILVEEKKLADSLYEILKKQPERFGELAALYSLDTNNKNNEGMLREFSGGVMVKPFEDACFKQPINVIGKPVKSPFGYHIIRVLKREKKDTSKYQSEIKAVENTLKRKKLNEVAVKSEEKLRKMGKINVNLENINKLFQAFKYDSVGNVILDSLKDERKLVLATSIFGAWTIDDVIREAQKGGFGKVPFSQPEVMKNFIDRMLFFMTVYEKGRRMGGNLSKEFAKETDVKMAIICDQRVRKDIMNSIPTDDSLLVKFYKEKIDRFMEKGKAYVYIVSNNDLQKVNMVKDSLKIKKKDFQRFARLYSTIKPKEFAKPDYFIFDETDTTGYYQKAVETGKGKISDIFQNSKGYNIIYVVDVIPPRPKDLTDEFKSRQLKNEYLKFYTDSIYYDQIEKEKKNIKIFVNRNLFDKIVNQTISENKE